jgi:hypothetical protein
MLLLGVNIEANSIIAGAAIIQSFLIAGQVIVYRRQTKIMDGSLKATQQAADAAKQSAEVSMNAERAWVIEEIVFPDRLPDPNQIIEMSVGMKFKNTGRTPAKITNIKARFHTYRTHEGICPEPAYPNQRPIRELGTNGAIFAPNGSLMFAVKFEEGRCLSPEQMIQITNGDLRLCCYGKVEYIDAFENARVNQFCYTFRVRDLDSFWSGGFRREGPDEYLYAT